jgi:hypothetical protein
MKNSNQFGLLWSGTLIPALLAALLLSASPVLADDSENSWSSEAEEGPWYFSAGLTGMAGTYHASTLRDDFYSGGIILGADYLEQFGLTFGYTRSVINFKNGAPATNQNEFFLGGHKNFRPDGMKGTIGLRLDGHYTDNDDLTGNTDQVWAFAPILSFSALDSSYYADIGYAYSDYQNNLNVHQFTPTVGFAFNQKSDWVQLRGYFINLSNSNRAQGKKNTSAAQVKWTHWFAPENLLKLDNLSLGGMVGERVYAVDHDNLSVYNLADIQKGSVALDLSWKVAEETSLLLHAGHDSYENVTIQDKYSASALVLSLSRKW